MKEQLDLFKNMKSRMEEAFEEFDRFEQRYVHYVPALCWGIIIGFTFGLCLVHYSH